MRLFGPRAARPARLALLVVAGALWTAACGDAASDPAAQPVDAAVADGADSAGGGTPADATTGPGRADASTHNDALSGVDTLAAPDDSGGVADSGPDLDTSNANEDAPSPPDASTEPPPDAPEVSDAPSPPDASTEPQPDAVACPASCDDALDCTVDSCDANTGTCVHDSAACPKDPLAVFGSRYWTVYRPHFLSDFYEAGRVTDRVTAGVRMFGDTNIFMGYALSTFVYEYRAAHLPESLALVHEILDAYAALDALPANATFGYLIDDPLDGYVYRSDRGPDYETNNCLLLSGFCLPQLATRNNEPSGDQLLGTLRALKDVVDFPGPLVHGGVDLKSLARAHAHRIGVYLRESAFVMHNRFGQPVKRGEDQRWASWAFQRGVAAVTGNPKSDYEATWSLGILPVAPAQQRAISHLFIRGAVTFTASCVAGAQIDVGPLLGIPFTLDLECNEFNIGLGGDSAVISLSPDPASEDWFSKVVQRADLVAEGSALYALYARLHFNDDAPELLDTAARFLAAPSTPPTGTNLDPNGWCVSWRWAHDYDNPNRCIEEPHLGEVYSGLDYMLPRAFASAFGILPE